MATLNGSANNLRTELYVAFGIAIQLQAITNIIDGKQTTLDSLLLQGSSVLAAAGTALENSRLAGRLNEIRSGYKELREISVEKKKELLRALTEREAIAEHMENVETWLREKENTYKALGKLPLSSADLLRHLDEKKVWRYFN